MKRVSVLIVLLIATARAQSINDIKFPPLEFKPPKPVEKKLSNGMSVFLLEDHELPTISAFAMIRTGAIYEPADKLGLAQLTGEVMRSGGTRSLTPSELNDQLEFIAASVETSIGDESGQASLSVLKKDLETGLKLFAQVLREPAFRQEQLDLAKSKMRESIRRRNDFPSGIASREFTKLIYGETHPLARTLEMEHLERISPLDLVAFHQQYYQPNQMVLGVAGDFRMNEMMALLEKHLGDWKPAAVRLPQVSTVSTEWNPSVNFIAKDINQTNIRLGHLGIKQRNPDFFAVTVMDNILGSGGFFSRLFQSIRTQQGLAYAAYSNYGAGLREYGVFTVALETEVNSTGRAIQAVADQIRKMREEKVTAEELNIAKESVLNSFVFAFDNPSEVVNRQVRYRYFGLPDNYLQTYRDKIAQVSAEEVQQAARKYLHPEKLVILAVGPAKVKEDLARFGKIREIPLK